MTRGTGAQVVLFTCEHGGNKIPRKYQPLFRLAQKELRSHRGWDPGAKKIAEDLAKICKAPVFSADVSRLLVDLNRSENHPACFSEFSRALNNDKKLEILESYYQPYRRGVENWLSLAVKRACVFHFSIHSFTPKLFGEVRNCEIGLLYDPKSALERSTARELKLQLKTLFPELRVRMNYPYKGYMDGFTTKLRRDFVPDRYSGIEIELNQTLLEKLRENKKRLAFSNTLARCLSESLSIVERAQPSTRMPKGKS